MIYEFLPENSMAPWGHWGRFVLDRQCVTVQFLCGSWGTQVAYLIDE